MTQAPKPPFAHPPRNGNRPAPFAFRNSLGKGPFSFRPHAQVSMTALAKSAAMHLNHCCKSIRMLRRRSTKNKRQLCPRSRSRRKAQRRSEFRPWFRMRTASHATPKGSAELGVYFKPKKKLHLSALTLTLTPQHEDKCLTRDRQNTIKL